MPHTREFFVKDNFIYAETHYDMVKIDISDAQNPILVSRVEFAFGEAMRDDNGKVVLGFNYKETTESFELNSAEAKALKQSQYLYYDFNENLIPPSAVPSSFVGGGSASVGTVNRIAHHKEHVYVISSSKVHVFQDSPQNLSYVSSDYVSSGLETIYPDGDNLYVGSQSSMIILNVTNPEDPTYLSSYWHATACDPVYPNGDVAYVTLRTADFTNCPGDINALITVDVSNKNAPREHNQIEMASPYGMTMDGNLLYVGEGENGLKIFDATDPLNLVLVSEDKNVKAYDVMIHPHIPDLILTAGPNGIEQYEKLDGTFNIRLIGYINY